MAAGSAARRKHLRAAAAAAGAEVAALAADAAALAAARLSAPDALVLTAGSAEEVEPFWRTARRLEAPFLVLTDGHHRRMRASRPRGGWAPMPIRD